MQHHLESELSRQKRELTDLHQLSDAFERLASAAHARQRRLANGLATRRRRLWRGLGRWWAAFDALGRWRRALRHAMEAFGRASRRPLPRAFVSWRRAHREDGQRRRRLALRTRSTQLDALRAATKHWRGVLPHAPGSLCAV